MPYIIVPVTEKKKTIGYRVCKRDNPERCFSKEPLPKERAQRQRTAIVLSELGLSKKSSAPAPKPTGKGGNKKK